MKQPQPLLVTLALDPDTFELLNGLRTAHFPPARNIVPAHITLFHALPGAEEASLAVDLAELAARTPPVPLLFPRVRFIGRGVAVDVESPALVAARGELAQRWQPLLTPQDRQRYKPHVTIQNKAAPEAARQLFAELAETWQNHTGSGVGLLLWHYRGGPWEKAGSFRFGA